MAASEDKGFLLDLFDRSTSAWVRNHSLFSIPPLRPGGNDRLQRNRDIFVCTMLLLAALAILISARPLGAHSIWLVQSMAAFGLYRGVDVLINLARTGVFFSFRGDVLISDEPVWRLRRILIGIFMNYTELMLWYAIVYYYLSIVNEKSFSNSIVTIWAALNVSISTMTGGFGYVAPTTFPASATMLLQAVTTLTLIVLVAGVLISLLSQVEKKEHGSVVGTKEDASWIRPIVSFGWLYLLIWILIRPSLLASAT